MDNELRLLLNRYIHSEGSLSAVRAWISEHIWDAQPDIDNSIDQVAIGLIDLDDARIDEQKFRDLMMVRLGIFLYVEQQIRAYFSSHAHAESTSNSIKPIKAIEFFYGVEYTVNAEADTINSLASLPV